MIFSVCLIIRKILFIVIVMLYSSRYLYSTVSICVASVNPDVVHKYCMTSCIWYTSIVWRHVYSTQVLYDVIMTLTQGNTTTRCYTRANLCQVLQVSAGFEGKNGEGIPCLCLTVYAAFMWTRRRQLGDVRGRCPQRRALPTTRAYTNRNHVSSQEKGAWIHFTVVVLLKRFFWLRRTQVHVG